MKLEDIQKEVGDTVMGTWYYRALATVKDLSLPYHAIPSYITGYFLSSYRDANKAKLSTRMLMGFFLKKVDVFFARYFNLIPLLSFPRRRESSIFPFHFLLFTFFVLAFYRLAPIINKK